MHANDWTLLRHKYDGRIHYCEWARPQNVSHSVDSYCFRYHFYLLERTRLDVSPLAGKQKRDWSAVLNTDSLVQYGPETAPLRYRHLGGAFGAVGEWSMTFATVFGGSIASQRVGYQIWFWQLGSCILLCFCKLLLLGIGNSSDATISCVLLEPGSKPKTEDEAN